jgi:hypothetical protein
LIPSHKKGLPGLSSASVYHDPRGIATDYSGSACAVTDTAGFKWNLVINFVEAFGLLGITIACVLHERSAMGHVVSLELVLDSCRYLGDASDLSVSFSFSTLSGSSG